MCFPTKLRKYVSTHSRPKAAGFGGLGGYRIDIVSTHSRPKAAGICFTLCRAGCGLFQLTAARRRLAAKKIAEALGRNVSTHSRPKAAGMADALD